MRLQGKVAFITGAGSGIGRATARRFAEEGAVVAVNDLRAETAEATVADLPGTGHVAVPGDVCDSARIAEIIAGLDATHGRVDVVMNNAGVDKTPGDGWEAALAGEQQVVAMTDDGFFRMLDIHLGGAFRVIRSVLPIMQRNGRGSIINVSSIAGLAGFGQFHYSTAKAGLLGMTRSLARNVGPLGIRVNAICPGVIRTPMMEAVPDAMIGALVAGTPLQRVGEPEDIANAAVYLASDEAAFVTGQWISPNGGFVIA